MKFHKYRWVIIGSGILVVLIVILAIHWLMAPSKTPSRATQPTGTVEYNPDSGIPIDVPDTDTGTTSTASTCASYQAIDSRTWLQIVKDPDSYSNQCYTVYGEVTQFDSATGTNGFRANVGGVAQTPEYGFVNYPSNTVLTGDPSVLNDVVEQDLFTANVKVLGSYTYDTQIGGQTTVPQLQVDSITVTGSVSK